MSEQEIKVWAPLTTWTKAMDVVLRVQGIRKEVGHGLKWRTVAI